MIFADYHTHTILSHGKCTPKEVVLIAEEKGLRELAISEHAPSMSYGLKRHEFLELKDELKKLSETVKVKLLLGIESNFLGGGRLDIPNDVDFDIVIAGYHRSIPIKNGFSASALLQSFSPFSSPEKNTDEILRTLDNYSKVNILAHPNEYIRLNLSRIAKYAKERSILLEINNRHVTLTADDLRLCADSGAEFVINSDGHSREEICSFRNALSVAKEADVLSLVRNYSE